MKQKTGASADAIVRAYLVARDAFQLRALWNSIEALDNKVPQHVQLTAMRDVASLAERAVTWLLLKGDKNADIGGKFGAAVARINEHLGTLVTRELAEKIKQHTDSAIRNGMPKDLAAHIARLPSLAAAFDIVKIAMDQKTDAEDTARVYFNVGNAFHLDWLRQQAAFMPTDNHWQAEAISKLMDNLFTAQAGLTVKILKAKSKAGTKKDDVVDYWIKTQSDKTAPLARMFDELRGVGTLDLPMLVIAEQRLRGLYSS
jgi:glutamate dehydrogenase